MPRRLRRRNEAGAWEDRGGVPGANVPGPPAGLALSGGTAGGSGGASGGGVTTAGTLPARIIQGYFPGYANMRMKDCHPNYNLIMYSFAIGVGSSDPGAMVLGYAEGINTPANVQADTATLKAAGKVVILSIGGQYDLGASNIGFQLQTTAHVNRFVATVAPLITQYGFQGIDWDLEHVNNFSASAVVSASQQLKAQFGPGFIVAAAPYGLANSGSSHPNDSGGEIPLVQKYRDVITGLGSQFDLLSVQFYNNGDNTINAVKQTTSNFLASVNLPDSKMCFGWMMAPAHQPTSGGVTPTFCNDLWNSWRAGGREARGHMLWEISIDRYDNPSYRFATGAGPTVLNTP